MILFVNAAVVNIKLEIFNDYLQNSDVSMENIYNSTQQKVDKRQRPTIEILANNKMDAGSEEVGKTIRRNSVCSCQQNYIHENVEPRKNS